MNYPRIASRFYGSIWLVREDWHLSAGRILRPYLTGDASPVIPAPRPEIEGRYQGMEIDQGFALVRIEGAIGRHLDLFESCGGGYDLCDLEEQVQAVAARPDVHTVIFSFNTPGGMVAGVPEAARAIADLGEMKRTVAWIDPECCSAGYFMAAGCGEIYALSSAYVGSISAILAVLDSSRAFEMEGLKMEIFTDGKLKALGRPGVAVSDDQREYLEEMVRAAGASFKNFVSARRPQIPAEAMEGGFYFGETALELGLVDGFRESLADLISSLL